MECCYFKTSSAFRNWHEWKKAKYTIKVIFPYLNKTPFGTTCLLVGENEIKSLIKSFDISNSTQLFTFNPKKSKKKNLAYFFCLNFNIWIEHHCKSCSDWLIKQCNSLSDWLLLELWGHSDYHVGSWFHCCFQFYQVHSALLSPL